jgi:hypothetical protein
VTFTMVSVYNTRVEEATGIPRAIRTLIGEADGF